MGDAKKKADAAKDQDRATVEPTDNDLEGIEVDRMSSPIESLDLTAGEVLFHIAQGVKANGRIATALERLADKFAPVEAIRSIPGRANLIECAKGHGMQPGEDICQICYRADHPTARGSRPGPRAA